MMRKPLFTIDGIGQARPRRQEGQSDIRTRAWLLASPIGHKNVAFRSKISIENLWQKSPSAISLVGRIGEALRLQAQRRFAGGPHAARIPRFAPRPAVSIPAQRQR